LKEIPHDKFTKIAALKKRDIACVELGDLDEAVKCFERVKELKERIDS